MQAPINNQKPRILCPPGLHLCRLIQVVDLGSQRFKGGDPSRKLYFGFETLETGHVFKEDKGEQPFSLQTEFAFYMNSSGDKKTKLRQFVESWFNKPFPSEDEAAAFDFSKLIGRLAGVMIAHLPKKEGGMKAQIVGICPPDTNKIKGLDGLGWPKINPWVLYEIDNGEDSEFAKLPNFLQSKIRESDEFTRKGQPVVSEDDINEQLGHSEQSSLDDLDSEVPF